MIDITVMDGDKGYKSLKCAGHADYDEYGKDVVCSAVSMLVINTVNGIEKLTDTVLKVTNSNSKDGMLEVVFPNETGKDATLLIDSMILGIKNVIKQYGDGFVSLKIM